MMRKEKSSVIDILLDENNFSNLVVSGKDGKTMEFEQICVISDDDFVHAILAPISNFGKIPEGEPLLFTLNRKTNEFAMEEDEEVIAEIFKEYTAAYGEDEDGEEESAEDEDEDADDEEESAEDDDEENAEDDDEENDGKDKINQLIVNARLGNDKAQLDLGCNYCGKEIIQNYAKAAELFKDAAKQGNAAAQNHLGFCYYSGQGVVQDGEKAAELFSEAAEKGYHAAQFNLGMCYENGIGVKKDLVLAKYWKDKSGL